MLFILISMKFLINFNVGLFLMQWSCNGPLMELLMRNLRIEMSLLQKTINFSTEGDLFVNYNNIHKVCQSQHQLSC